MEKSLWAQAYSSDQKPTWEQIESFVSSQYWREFTGWIQKSYDVKPSIEYSIESGNSGWNVKFRKSSKALCTIYPDKGRFVVLVVVPPSLEPEAEYLFLTLSDHTQAIFRRARPMAMGRWLMIPIDAIETVNDAQRLITLRVPARATEAASPRSRETEHTAQMQEG